MVVLKLANRTRAAGVIPVPVPELDEVLEEVLQPPKKLEAWLKKRADAGITDTLNMGYGSYDEQVRHWWSNECPFFVAERYATSLASSWEGKEYDGTMRVAFALRRKGSSEKGPDSPLGENSQLSRLNTSRSEMPPAEDLEIEWLGGYWKLPKVDISSPKLRERIISAARTSGTAYVAKNHLQEIYAAMGDSIQKLFGGTEPTISTLAESYDHTPAYASYFIARAAVALKDLGSCRKAMKSAAAELEKSEHGFERECSRSFVTRGFGVFDAMQPPGKWKEALVYWEESIEALPCNASTLYLIGMAHLEMENPSRAVDYMHRSLILDLDFKAAYLNLGVAYLRLNRLEEAVACSEACLRRHPESPQCHYNIAVACYFQAKNMEGTLNPTTELREEYERLRKRSLTELTEARESDEAQRMLSRGRCDVPFLDEDDMILEAVRPSRGQLGKPKEPPRKGMRSPEIGPRTGWRFFGWRT